MLPRNIELERSEEMPELWEVAVAEKPRARSRPAEVLASVPAIIAGAGERAAWRFLEFFTANIRNKNTRRAYARAVRGAGSIMSSPRTTARRST